MSRHLWTRLSLIDDEAIKMAMRHLLERTKLLVEPAGAAGTAALLSGKIKVPAGAKVCCFPQWRQHRRRRPSGSDESLKCQTNF